MPNIDDEAVFGPMQPEAARDQAAEFLGVSSGVTFDLGKGQTWTLPNQAFMPPDMKRRYLEHLRFMNEDLDTETIADPITGKRRKQSKWPLRLNGTLIDEDELLCRALMGDEVYEQFLAAGGVSGQVRVHWNVMNLQMQDRVKRDPKSN